MPDTCTSDVGWRLRWQVRWLAAGLLAVSAPLAVVGQSEAGFRTTFEGEWNGAVRRVEAIAAAIPEETYGWRPGEGVRSVSEVLLHIAGGNFMHAEILGRRRPDDLPEDLETITGKEQVLGVLRRSVEQLEAAMDQAFAGDLDRALPKIEGQYNFGTPRNVLMRAVSHGHEHGGQLVAYARMNGVVPPWSL